MTSRLQLIQPIWPAPECIDAFTTTRQGGFSGGAYAGLNLARHVGDEAAAVDANRRLLLNETGLPSQPCWLNQTHSSRVTTIGDDYHYEAGSDAAVSRKKGQVLVIMTADCLPILLCSEDGSEVAAIHAGWRGLLDGIIVNTLSSMKVSPHKLIAWIGPAISQQRFEVGDEVYHLFTGSDHSAEAYFLANRPEHWLCDLPGLAQDQLNQHGVSQVFRSGLCSYDDAAGFYSYRRNKVTGRMASLIWINNDA